MVKINEIYNEDCLDTMKKMTDNFIDLTLTSPPYDNLRTYNGYSFDFENIAKELYRVTKKGGVLVWVVGDATIKGSETGTSFKQALFFKECGFNLHDTMIYCKKNPIPLKHNRYQQCFEYMFVLSKGKPKTFNSIMDNCSYAGFLRKTQATYWQGTSSIRSSSNKHKPTKNKKNRINIWKFSVGITRNKNHPAPFPDLLANDHIVSWSNAGDLIYDPFMGSGTTAKMALLNNRNYIGSEISKEYCNIANNILNKNFVLMSN